jgi:uncharacterized protein YabN with tetrapyrrole methylase and pyrophosphatase domain
VLSKQRPTRLRWGPKKQRAAQKKAQVGFTCTNVTEVWKQCQDEHKEGKGQDLGVMSQQRDSQPHLGCLHLITHFSLSSQALTIG